ncbi:MAG: nitroreductase family protein [Bacteroidales bacterium]|nr:nitroreductase family protein [Bacteroidales bacterium]
MADNYLEKREEAVRERRPVVKRVNTSLDTLLKRNRSYRGYDKSRKVTEEDLRKIVSVATLVGSGKNLQRLRYRLVTGEEAAKVLPNIVLGAALPEEHLPKPGTEPEAFIVACCTGEENKVVDIDLGIAAQSMLLKATEMGLGGIFILNFKADAIREALNLPSKPIAVIAIGKGAENIYLIPVHADASLDYYRKDGVHFVPKLCLEDILINP